MEHVRGYRRGHQIDAQEGRRSADLAATIDDGPDFRVATVWVVSDSAANRTIIGRYPEIFAISFPGSSRDWVRALTSGSAPPAQPGLVWYDVATNRIHEWRRPAGYAG